MCDISAYACDFFANISMKMFEIRAYLSEKDYMYHVVLTKLIPSFSSDVSATCSKVCLQPVSPYWLSIQECCALHQQSFCCCFVLRFRKFDLHFSPFLFLPVVEASWSITETPSSSAKPCYFLGKWNSRRAFGLKLSTLDGLIRWLLLENCRYLSSFVFL